MKKSKGTNAANICLATNVKLILNMTCNVDRTFNPQVPVLQSCCQMVGT